MFSPGDACSECGGRLKPSGRGCHRRAGLPAGSVRGEPDRTPAPGLHLLRGHLPGALAVAPDRAGTPRTRPARPCPGRQNGDHLPLYRQSQIFEREGIDLDRSTLADWVGKSTALLEPLAAAIGRHVLGGAAIFADDTPIKLQAPGNGKTKTARIWTYVRDERSWLGPDPPAACYRFTCDRKGEHPANHLAGYKGWMHADGYAGFNELFRSGGVREVACLAHIRRKFVDVFQAEGSLHCRGGPQAYRRALRHREGGDAASQPTSGCGSGRRTPSRSSMTWRAGCRPNCRRSRQVRAGQGNPLWLGPHEEAQALFDHGCLEADNDGAERALKPVATMGSLCTPSSSV